MDVEARIKDFKKSLSKFDERFIVRNYITFGNCYILDDFKYTSLKGELADHFKIHPNEVLIVGSSKMGFSISENVVKEKYRYRHFGDNSDIDVAIVSPKLFDDIWKLSYDYFQEGNSWPNKNKFVNYHFQGWMRPDKLPTSAKFESFQNYWWDYFEQVTYKGDYGKFKIRGGLYRDWHFLENYQLTCVKECMSLLKRTTL